MKEFQAKGVVWDFDGTILDSMALFDDTISEILRKHGLPVPSREVLARHHYGDLHKTIRAVSNVKEGSLLETLCSEFIWGEDHHYEHPDDLYFADALSLLRRNHEAGLKQIVISNRFHHSDSRKGSPRNLASRQPLAGLIDMVVCGDDSDYQKPDVRAIDDATRQLGLSHESLLVIGDQSIDAKLGHNLGALAVLVARSGESIPHLEELGDGWQAKTSVVRSLDEVSITLA